MKKQEQRIVIKIGSSSLINNDGTINENIFMQIIDVINSIMKKDKKVILVTSGAIAIGRNILGLKKKPEKIALKQACAAIGQARLVEEYQKYANKYQLICSQILVNHDDFENRNRMLHLTNTIEELLDNNVIPIINENDALAVEEIKVGDNDTLSSLIVPLVKANLLILVSDIDGLYDKNPNEYSDAKKIDEVDCIDYKIDQMVGGVTSSVGTGGMMTKIHAARIATKADCDVIIMNACDLDQVMDLLNGKKIGTLFKKEEKHLKNREHWLIYYSYSKGYIKVDSGAKLALKNNKSLLASGIIEVNGDFNKNSVVFITDQNDIIFAKAITNYSSDTIQLIKGKHSVDFKNLINNFKDEIVHIDNLIFVDGDEYGKLK